MILESLTVRRSRYSTDDAPHRWVVGGNVEFSGETGKIELALNDDTSRRILAIVAEQLVETSRALAENMSAEIITGVALAPPEEAT
jgi:hypothetical protein